MKVDVYSSQSHYSEHLLPIWRALAPEIQGEFLGVDLHKASRQPDHITMVASFRDMDAHHSAVGFGKYIYVEHGAGQSYTGSKEGAHWRDYSGCRGEGHHQTLGYICPSERVADLWRSGGKRAVAVGCPKLDDYHNTRTWQRPIANRITFGFHWPCKIAPEAGTAYFHYADALPGVADKLREQGFSLTFTTHPKWEGTIDHFLRDDCGMKQITAHQTLLASAMLIMDTSSLAYEFAARDRPVIALNAPEWRRNINHGLRFWDLVPGLQVDYPDQLLELDPADENVLERCRLDRERVIPQVYAFNQGDSSQRAVEAILGWIEG